MSPLTLCSIRNTLNDKQQPSCLPNNLKKINVKENWAFFRLPEDYTGRIVALEWDLARLSLELLLHLKDSKCSIPPAKDGVVSAFLW